MTFIAVIADDFSGAAELGGVAAARGFDVEVQRGLPSPCQADVLAIDSQTRNLPPDAAKDQVAQVAAWVAARAPLAIFKKTDSVLRGNVGAEIEAILTQINLRRSLLVPANPGKQRCVVDGIYLIDRQPLHETLFGEDPEYPRNTARVVELAAATGTLAVHSGAFGIDMGRPLPDHGIVIPDVRRSEDLLGLAPLCDEQTLAAGAAEFFDVMLDRWTSTVPVPVSPIPKVARTLFVCGSLTSWRLGVAKLAERRGTHVAPMNAALALADSDAAREPLIEQWSEQVVRSIEHGRATMMAIGRPPLPERATDHDLLNSLIDAATRVVARIPIDRVLAEGGATAAALARNLGWHRFRMLPSPYIGVGFMRPCDPPQAAQMVIKPGSYPWPDDVWP